MSEQYRVKLEMFEGPLDLLLHLIRRAEVDIVDIPISRIADQFVASLEGIERIDIELAGEFLVMAATLMEIKSRMLSPEPRAEDAADGERARDADQADPRAELVRQLLEYKRLRDSADALERRREAWERRAPNAPAAFDADVVGAVEDLSEQLDLEDIDLVDLVEAFRGILASVNMDRLGDHAVVSDETPIELHAEDIVDRLRRDARLHADGRSPEISLREVFTGRTRAEMVGLFLAMLDLIRHQRVAFRQDGGSGEILMRLREPEEMPAEEAGAPASSEPSEEER